jgi:hypothetical protein
MAGGALVSTMGLTLPKVPEQANQETMGMWLMIGTLALALGVAPLARRIRGSYWLRALIVAALCYVCFGINTSIEAAVFTNLGGMSTMVVFLALPCLLFGATVALLFRPTAPAEPFGPSVARFFGARTAGQWAWRLAAAVCAFPLIYWSFGMMVAPFVLEYYRQGQFGLTLPSIGVVVLVQLGRSSLFLLAVLPVLVMWSGSRRRLVWTLGLAFYVLVGLFGMIQGYWLPPALRISHNLEILADSFVHALAIVLLLVPGKAAWPEVPSAVSPLQTQFA